ncbi:hypothetical protein HPB51_006687 [Rhipicephalus microplus]|uniref:GB1/RHD3-type G domain-containing protein n=1 Tax=Rhipicephalus microplus TaxID=6941 RepID=A0A9J6E722_RHIMP|nr:hypothetical protein HPB51_006687 [Rhipicephalus microplus]
MESWASHGVGSGHELQIVRISEECIELDEGALRRLLLNERVRDKPVAVVSVAGAFRTGKSFLLGFFLRYLQHSDRSSWLEDRDAPLRGFDWRAGCERHTTGILVWNEVFLVRSAQRCLQPSEARKNPVRSMSSLTKYFSSSENFRRPDPRCRGRLA